MGRMGKFVKAILVTTDRLVDSVLTAMAVMLVIFGTFSVWDSWRLANGAEASKVAGYKPVVSSTEEGPPSFAELLNINDDAIAWITVDGTNIDYPIMKSKDNADYLNRDVYGNFAMSGTPFLDYRNSADFSDAYSIVYGHHMEGGRMFGQVEDFLVGSFLAQHKTGTLMTPTGVYGIKWFAAIKADGYDSTIYETIPQDAEYTEQMTFELMEHIYELAETTLDVEVTDRIIALSTCNDAETNGRILLFGYISDGLAKIEKGEAGA